MLDSDVSDLLMEAVGRYHMGEGDCHVWGWRQCRPHGHFHSSNLQKPTERKSETLH